MIAVETAFALSALIPTGTVLPTPHVLSVSAKNLSPQLTVVSVCDTTMLIAGSSAPTSRSRRTRAPQLRVADVVVHRSRGVQYDENVRGQLGQWLPEPWRSSFRSPRLTVLGRAARHQARAVRRAPCQSGVADPDEAPPHRFQRAQNRSRRSHLQWLQRDCYDESVSIGHPLDLQKWLVGGQFNRRSSKKSSKMAAQSTYIDSAPQCEPLSDASVRAHDEMWSILFEGRQMAKPCVTAIGDERRDRGTQSRVRPSRSACSTKADQSRVAKMNPV